MMKNEKHYSFHEWKNLDSEAKGKIINQWDPYKNDTNHVTQNNIVNGFLKQYSNNSSDFLTVGFGFFGWHVPCIYVIVNDSKIRLPQNFAGLFLNKGTVQNELGDNKFVIKWRYGGSKNLIEIKDSKMKPLGLYEFRKRKNTTANNGEHEEPL
jgi:hypothetical protein